MPWSCRCAARFRQIKPEDLRVRREQLTRHGCRVLDRLSQPSSAAGLAALLALTLPELATYAPAIVDLALTVIAIGAAIVAMVKCECRSCNGHDHG
jgi:hypothetical protein